MATRIERDPLGEKAVPADALYGIQTLRAAENFPISGLRPLPVFVDAVVWIKRAAALTHKETGRLDPRRTRVWAASTGISSSWTCTRRVRVRATT
jgi:aspartate ammonia-lyase